VSEQKQPKFRIHDNAAIVEFYANKFVGSFFDGSAVSLTFGAMRMSPEKTDEGPREGQLPDVYVTHRLTLPPAAAVELINALNTILTMLQKGPSAKPQQSVGQAH
jgi:hypothetical protein